jgi:alpha-beta hydrolase superfamily lysophospholipase
MNVLCRESVTIQSLGDTLSGTLFLADTEPHQPSPALIICHGAGEFKENYFELCEYLANRGFSSLALDMHGHGASGGTRHHVKITEWVADIAAAVQFLAQNPKIDSERIGAFGISSGGTAILEASLANPQLKTLIAMDATVRNSMPLGLTLFFKSLIALSKIKRAFSGTDWRIPLLKLSGGVQFASDPEVDRGLQSNPRTLEFLTACPLPGAAEAFFVDTIRRVDAITIPTMVVWGEDDKLDPPETARQLFAALTCKKELHIIPGNGHAGHLDRHREKVFELTAHWLSQNLGLCPSNHRAAWQESGHDLRRAA